LVPVVLPASGPIQPGVRRLEQVINQAPSLLCLREVEVLIENLKQPRNGAGKCGQKGQTGRDDDFHPVAERSGAVQSAHDFFGQESIPFCRGANIRMRFWCCVAMASQRKLSE
jgi:hypothetical protein